MKITATLVFAVLKVSDKVTYSIIVSGTNSNEYPSYIRNEKVVMDSYEHLIEYTKAKVRRFFDADDDAHVELYDYVMPIQL
jgi:hypothetical protein